MPRFGCRPAAMRSVGIMKSFLWMAVVLSLGPTSRAFAADTEVRDFTVHIDGRDCGQWRMTISRRDDGTVTMAGQASVVVRRLGIAMYRYTFAVTEVWQDGKDGKLLAMSSTSDDNGKKFEVKATTEPNGLQVRVNGQARNVRGDVWTTTYWKLAHARFHNQTLPLLDADTGKDYGGRLDYLGTEQLTVAGQTQNCLRFRVTGGPNPVEVWYDAQHRLVRQDFTEDGHRTIIQLAGVRR